MGGRDEQQGHTQRGITLHACTACMQQLWQIQVVNGSGPQPELKELTPAVWPRWHTRQVMPSIEMASCKHKKDKMKYINYMHAQIYFTRLMLVHISQAYAITVQPALSFVWVCFCLFIILKSEACQGRVVECWVIDVPSPSNTHSLSDRKCNSA